MPLPCHEIERSARRLPRRSRRWVAGLVCSAVIMGGGLLRADDRPASAPAPAPDPLEVATRQSLSRETWPLFREAYLRLFFEDDQDPEREKRFYERVRIFFGAMATATGGSLTEEFATDPVAWVALAWTYLHLAGNDGPGGSSREKSLSLAEDASRKGIALGDPQAIASYSLACSLVSRGLFQGPTNPLTGDMERRLAEAEERLRHVERVSARANVNLWRGHIASLRGDTKNAVVLLRRATEDRPYNIQAALAYLRNVLQHAADPPARLADLTGPFVDQFPKDPNTRSLHAVALYRDGRFPEAAEALRRARDLDEESVQLLGDVIVKAIAEGRHLTPELIGGLQAMKAGQHESAASVFRRALAEDPRNALAARFLSRAIVNRLASVSLPLIRPAAATAAGEIGDLCRRFPDDSEMQGDLAVALHLDDRHIEAAQALDTVQRLGARPEEIIDPAGVLAIRQGAESDARTRYRLRIALAVVVGAALWISTMFALGAVLAVCIPRIPKSVASTGHAWSRREVWLERFYLLVLSLGLLVFYASVPVVAIGLLVVTLAVFGVFLALRIFHFGVLHRGLWATWNVLRCALMGPHRGVLGIEATADKHPRLFEALHAVAERLQTHPVDTVYLTPSSNISVHQEGSGPFGLLGKRQRVLEIGISTLPLLTRDEFHSILAHEYGHFSHKDTFYSRFIFQVSASLATSLAVMNAAAGALNYVNPFYWFWWLYLRAYTLLSTGFSRSREFLADRRAAAAYGKRAFISGLTKVAVDGVLFESTVYANVHHLLNRGQAFTNAFDAFRHSLEGTEMVESRERLLEEMRRTRPKWLDTHPTFSERLAAVADFPDVAPPGEPGSGLPRRPSPPDPMSESATSGETDPAIELLSDPQAVEAELTRMLTDHIHRSYPG